MKICLPFRSDDYYYYYDFYYHGLQHSMAALIADSIFIRKLHTETSIVCQKSSPYWLSNITDNTTQHNTRTHERSLAHTHICVTQIQLHIPITCTLHPPPLFNNKDNTEMARGSQIISFFCHSGIIRSKWCRKVNVDLIAINFKLLSLT